MRAADRIAREAYVLGQLADRLPVAVPAADRLGERWLVMLVDPGQLLYALADQPITLLHGDAWHRPSPT